jgi:hypothetical protein
MIWQRSKKLTAGDITLRTLGGLAAVGLLYVAMRSTPELIRYLRIRQM